MLRKEATCDSPREQAIHLTSNKLPLWRNIMVRIRHRLQIELFQVSWERERFHKYPDLPTQTLPTLP